MKKHNRTLIVVFGFAVVVLAIVISNSGVLNQDSAPPVAIEVTEDQGGVLDMSPQEAMGDPLKEVPPEDHAQSTDQKAFQQILNELSSCLDLRQPGPKDPVPIMIESIVSFVQDDLGPSTGLTDRWVSWHLRNQDGQDRQIRLEIGEDENGKMLRHLHYSVVDKEGQPIAIELPPEKALNPSDEIVNQMLKEGNVFFKEKSGVASFVGGEHIEYVEKNGTLSEFEFQKGDRLFRCENLKSDLACQCVR